MKGLIFLQSLKPRLQPFQDRASHVSTFNTITMNQEQLDSLFGSIEVPEYTVKVENDSGDYRYDDAPYMDITDVEVRPEEICLVPTGLANLDSSGVMVRGISRYELSSLDGNDEFIGGHHLNTDYDPSLADKQTCLSTKGSMSETYPSYSNISRQREETISSDTNLMSVHHAVSYNAGSEIYSLEGDICQGESAMSQSNNTKGSSKLKKERKQKKPEKQSETTKEKGAKRSRQKNNTKKQSTNSKGQAKRKGKRTENKILQNTTNPNGCDLDVINNVVMESLSNIRSPSNGDMEILQKEEFTVLKAKEVKKKEKSKRSTQTKKKKKQAKDLSPVKDAASQDGKKHKAPTRKEKAKKPTHKKKAAKGKLSVKIAAKSKSSHSELDGSNTIDLSRVIVKSEHENTISCIKKEIQEHYESTDLGGLSLIVEDEENGLNDVGGILSSVLQNKPATSTGSVPHQMAEPISFETETQEASIDRESQIVDPEHDPNSDAVSYAASDDDSKKPIACEYCGKQFALPSQMTVHLRRHSGVKPYKCKVCGRSFAESGDMRKHERIHTGEKPYSCPTCGKAFALSGNLAKHKLIHTNIRPFKCHYCDSAFRRAEGLKKHIQTHTGEKPFTCDVCHEKFARAGSLKEHYRRHTGEKPYACEYCNQRYARSCDLDKHIRVHTNEKPYVCSVCSRGFKQSVVLRRHMRIHTGEKNYVCSECGKAFSLPGALKIHFRLHTNEKPYKCEICGKRFGNPSNRDTHQKVHVDGKKVCCEVCGKAFVDEKVLDEHKKVHAEKKPYHCDKCKKCFTCPSQLEMHYRVHSNVRPFTCTICNHAFKQKSTAETHLTKIHHLKKEEWTTHITQADIKRRFLSLSNL